MDLMMELLDAETPAPSPATPANPGANTLGQIEVARQAPTAALPHQQSRTLGAPVLVDPTVFKTAGAAPLH